MMPYLINWVKSESMPYQTITPNLPHFPSAGQPENMRKRARGTGQGGEDVSMSKNLQEPLEQKKNKPSSRVPGVPSTRKSDVPALAERWSKQMLEQVHGGTQTQLSFIPAQLGIKKKVHNYAFS
jgi:hypothetical protein